MQTALRFEQGPIRPPSEAGSLLLRITRNCPWNKCAFCATYKKRKFSRRSMDEIKADIDAARAIYDEIKKVSVESGAGGDITSQVLTRVWEDSGLNDCYRSVALWLAHGGETVFLQDANSIMLSTDNLVTIMNYIKEKFPQVKRMTSYARALTLKQKSVEDYRRLKEAGLSRLHVGMESGSDKVLEMISKGCKSEHLIEGGRKVVEAGLSLCLYLIPGIGGRALSKEHALESARVVNAINPGFVRFRSLYVKGRTPLAEMYERGEFDAPSEDEIVQEIRLFIDNLENVTTSLVSDHMLNLLQELNGKLPEDKQAMLDTIDEYLNLSPDERLMFQLGARGGVLRSLDDFRQPLMRKRLEQAKKQIDSEIPGGIPEYLEDMKRRFV